VELRRRQCDPLRRQQLHACRAAANS
jgi:hypothetical protein